MVEAKEGKQPTAPNVDAIIQQFQQQSEMKLLNDMRAFSVHMLLAAPAMRAVTKRYVADELLKVITHLVEETEEPLSTLKQENGDGS